jgi:hypothetical protein
MRTRLILCLLVLIPLPASAQWTDHPLKSDALVVETTGFNDKTWLDGIGHPHTEALRVTERLRRRDFGHLDVQITIDDPKAYEKPWTVSLPTELATTTDLVEYVCVENEKSLQHLVGR